MKINISFFVFDQYDDSKTTLCLPISILNRCLLLEGRGLGQGASINRQTLFG